MTGRTDKPAQTQPSEHRNDPRGSHRPQRVKNALSLTLAFALALALIAILIADIAATTPASAPTFTVPSPVTNDAGPTPQAWFYDEENNQHWDPTPGHNHWHQGPPPPPEERPSQP